jgi:hypothetical protein
VTEFLDPKMIAEIVVDELLNHKVIDEREFVKKMEWNVYEDFVKTRSL